MKKKVLYGVIVLGMGLWMACSSAKSEDLGETFPFKVSVEATREEIYFTHGKPNRDLALSPRFTQLLYENITWQKLTGDLIFYLEDDHIRSIAFVLPEEYTDYVALENLMNLLYGDDREEQIRLLQEQYYRDAKEGWFSTQLEGLTLASGRLNDYWLTEEWVIATNSGLYPYEFIAYVPKSGFHFTLEDYISE